MTAVPVSEREVAGVLRIHHLGMVVENADRTADAYRRGLGLEPVAAEERPGEHRVVFLRMGESLLEMIQPLGPASPWAAVLRERGEGAHHVALEVADVRASVAGLTARGFRTLDPRPRRSAGSVMSVFLDPTTTGGTLLELVQAIRSAP